MSLLVCLQATQTMTSGPTSLNLKSRAYGVPRHSTLIQNTTSIWPLMTVSVAIPDLKMVPRQMQRSAWQSPMVCAFSYLLLRISVSAHTVRNLPRNIFQLARKINQPELPQLVRHFLYGVLNPDPPTASDDLASGTLPDIPENLKVYVYQSARVVYYAPSDISGLRGMHQERIRSTSRWYCGRPRRDCVFVGNVDSPDAPGFKSLLVARVFLFFSFKYYNIRYPCALVHWFSTLGDTPDDQTGMWVVQPDYLAHQRRLLEVIHLDTILRGAHLIGVPGADFLPSYPKIDSTMSLDSFKSFYVNKYADHHAHEITF